MSFRGAENGRGSPDPSAQIGLWVTLLVSIFAWIPATYPGYWMGLEGFGPIFNAADNSPLARIATRPDVWQGVGSGAYLLARPLILMGLSPTVAVRWSFILALVMGSLGVYTWLRPRFGDRPAGLAGLLYLFAPPLLAAVYIRGSLSDALIAGLLPLALAGAAGFPQSRSPSAMGVLVISLLWAWRTQAGMALFLTAIVLVYALWVERDQLTSLAVFMIGAAGFTSLLPLWNVRSPAHVTFSEHFVHIYQFFGTGWQVASSIPGWQDDYPFQLGYVAVLLFFLTGWLLLFRHRIALIPLSIQHRLDTDPSLLRLLTFCITVTSIVIIFTLSISQPFWQATRAERLLTYPWQLMPLLIPFLAAAGAGTLILLPALQRLPLWAVLCCLILLASYNYLTTDFTQVEAPRRPVASFGDDSLIILDATVSQMSTDDNVSSTVQLDIRWQTMRTPTFDYNVFFQALATDPNGAQIVVSQLDTQPMGGIEPATTWQPGQIYTDTYQLDLSALPATIPSKSVNFIFGYYDWRDGTRLTVDGGLDDKLAFRLR